MRKQLRIIVRIGLRSSVGTSVLGGIGPVRFARKSSSAANQTAVPGDQCSTCCPDPVIGPLDCARVVAPRLFKAFTLYQAA